MSMFLSLLCMCFKEIFLFVKNCAFRPQILTDQTHKLHAYLCDRPCFAKFDHDVKDVPFYEARLT